jgi:hypothetical protein
MSDRNEDNLKELFSRFLNSEQAAKAIEDIQRAEQILREHPAPEPDDMLIANIKAEIALNLLPRKAHVFERMVYKIAAVAAAILIITAIGLNLFERDKDSKKLVYASIIPRAVWESDDIAADDDRLANLIVEFEQIEEEVSSLQLGENGGKSNRAIEELEMELIEINSDFWKG